MARRRRMSAKQRRYFGGGRRSSRRSSSRRSYSRRRSSGGGRSGWIPLSGKEIMLDFGIGAVVGPLSAWLSPYQQKYLGMFGNYSDEAGLAIVGAVANKWGSGLIKDAGRELFRVAVISAGQQTGANFLGGAASGSAMNYNQGTIYG